MEYAIDLRTSAAYVEENKFENFDRAAAADSLWRPRLRHNDVCVQ